MIQNQIEDLQEILSYIIEGKPFAFSRYGDGEYRCIEGINVGKDTQAYSVDGWEFYGGADHLFSRDLRKSLNHKEMNYFYGITCPCCNKSICEYYLSKLKCPDSCITTANLLINGNHERFMKGIASLLGDKPTLFGGNKLDKTKWKGNLINIEGNVVDFYLNNKMEIESMIAKEVKNKEGEIYLFALGPLSCILIDIAYRNNPDNFYIDIGSSFDQILYGKATRMYQTLPFNDQCNFNEYLRNNRNND